MNTALEYSTRVVQEGGRRCKKSTLNELVHLTPLRIPLMNPPSVLVDVFSVDPSLATVKMRQIDWSQAAFGLIYRFLGGFPHAFTGPKSPQCSPEEGF
jgi:hypothetical protein